MCLFLTRQINERFTLMYSNPPPLPPKKADRIIYFPRGQSNVTGPCYRPVPRDRISRKTFPPEKKSERPKRSPKRAGSGSGPRSATRLGFCTKPRRDLYVDWGGLVQRSKLRVSSTKAADGNLGPGYFF